MNTDEIIEMAKQAGCIPRRHPEYWEDVQVFATPDVLVAFAKLVEDTAFKRWAAQTRLAVQNEREACAKVCDDIDVEYEGEDVLATWCSRAIRARGEA